MWWVRPRGGSGADDHAHGVELRMRQHARRALALPLVLLGQVTLGLLHAVEARANARAEDRARAPLEDVRRGDRRGAGRGGDIIEQVSAYEPSERAPVDVTHGPVGLRRVG